MRRLLLLISLLALLGSHPLAQDSFEDLARRARTGKNYDRARAVRSLAELDRPDAWDVLVELLGEESGEAGGSAQWYLGTCDDVDVIERLMTKEGIGAKDELQRWRATEALARSAVEVDVAPLWKLAAKDRSADVRRVAWAALEARGESALGFDKDRAKRTRALLDAASKDKDVTARGRALVAAAALLGADARPVIVKASTEKKPGLRVAAATAAGQLAGSFELFARLAEDEHWAVRRAALEARASAPDRDAMQFLVARLQVESRARLVARLVALLREFSGLRHGADVRPWQGWADALEPDWTPADRVERPEPLEVSSAWNGVPILSGRVAFLIDLSGSIREERGDGRSRKNVVDEELAAALSTLDPSAEFLLVGYHSEPLIWEDKPKPATKKNVAAALKWFRDIHTSGPGNLWSAIEATWALSDEMDTLFVLHDGAPTGDVLYRAELYREQFLAQNLTRGTFFDTVLVDSSRFVRERFTELAERSGGIAAARELDGKEER